MKIALTGTEELKAEILPLISQGNIIKEFDIANTYEVQSDFFDVVIDLSFDNDPLSRAPLLAQIPTSCYLVGAVFCQLSLTASALPFDKTYGICAFPTLLSRSVLEYSSPLEKEIDPFILSGLHFEKGIRVEDRIGMATPRIISMIVNEAYYTLQEGTASKKDIDLGMKLGTAYPKGPFEWAEKIGPKMVYKLLHTVYQDTMDERYKICNRLKTEALTTFSNS